MPKVSGPDVKEPAGRTRKCEAIRCCPVEAIVEDDVRNETITNRNIQGQEDLLHRRDRFCRKVTLSMLLHNFPDIGKVYATVRARDANESKITILDEHRHVSQTFDPLREKYGDGFEDFIKSKVVPVNGDVGNEFLGLDEKEATKDNAGHRRHHQWCRKRDIQPAARERSADKCRRVEQHHQDGADDEKAAAGACFDMFCRGQTQRADLGE